MTRDDIVFEARQWVGTPYLDCGRSRKGIDCLGLIVVVSRPWNIPHEDERRYSRWPDPQQRMIHQFDRFLVPVNPMVPAPGTIGIFAMAKLPAHAGIFSMKHGQLHIIHAMVYIQRVAEHAFAPSRKELRLMRLYAYPGMEA